MPCSPPSALSPSRRLTVRVVHAVIGAVLARECELLVGRCAGDDARAHDLAELDRGEARAARSAEDGQRLAAPELAALLQRVIRGAIGDDQAAAAVGVEPCGHFRQPFCGDGELLPRRAPARIADHAVARGKPAHAFAQAFDGAGEFRPGRKRKRRLVLVLPGDDQQVEEVQRRGLDPHHGLARPGHRVRQVGHRQVLRLARAGADQCFHGENLQVLSGFSGIWPYKVPTCFPPKVECGAADFPFPILPIIRLYLHWYGASFPGHARGQ